MIPRVHAADAQAVGDLLEVSGEEAHWLRDVLRLAHDDRVRVFDGRGSEWDAVVTSVAKGRVGVRLECGREAAPEPRVAYTLVMPVLKGEASDHVVRDAVMMGVARIRPFVSRRSEAGHRAALHAARRARWERVAMASAKQCGRAWLPVVEEMTTFEAILDERTLDCRLLLVEPALGVGVAIADVAAPEVVTIATGPEGGWAADEARAAMDAGWRPVTAGARVLRAESAPLVALAACQAVWRER